MREGALSMAETLNDVLSLQKLEDGTIMIAMFTHTILAN